MVMTRLPKDIDLNLLPVFDALMRHESVTRAAQDVVLTQASASNALSRLRLALGDRVLERQGNKMVPTALARALWPAVSDALGQISTALAALEGFDPATARDRFRIGLDDYAVSTLGAELGSRVQAEAQGVTLEILPATHPANDDQLRRGEMDLFCGAVWRPAPGLASLPLWEEDFVGLAARGHGFGTHPPIEAVLAVPHVLVSTRGVVRGNLDAGLMAIDRSRRVAATVPTYDAAARLAAQSGLLFFCGRRLARRFAALHDLVPFEPPVAVPGFDMKLLWNRRDDGSLALAWLRGQLRDLAGA